MSASGAYLLCPFVSLYFSWEACGLVCSSSPVKPSDCGLFKRDRKDADLWETFRVFSLQRNIQAVALPVAVLLVGLQTVESIALHATGLLGGLQNVGSLEKQTSW